MAEAAERRRPALRERKHRMEEAWQNWTKPFLKPGDIVSMLRPTFETDGHRQDLSSFPDTVPCPQRLTITDKNSRVLVVYRYWTEQEERGRHLIWIPGGATIDYL